MRTEVAESARVWIACLACYNDGRLVGDWFPADIAGDVTLAEVHAEFGGERMDCEELWVFDHEGLPIRGECSPADAQAMAEVVDSVDDWQRAPFRAWITSGDHTEDGAGLPDISDFEERYAGEWESFTAYAEELFTDCGYAAELPEHLAPYFDMTAWARDLSYDYTTEPAPGGGVYVFRSL